MSTTELKHITISNDYQSNDGLDFDFLISKGREYIEELGRNLWTNYNYSDPGITFKEAICYALTDLNLRISQPIADIIASRANNLGNMQSQFPSAKNILTTAPVTALDYRKLFIDIEGVKNVWIEKYHLPIYVECNPDHPNFSFESITGTDRETSSFNTKGLYSVLVDFEKELPNDQTKVEIMDELAILFHENRNLCEDLAEIKEVQEKCVKICAKIQINPQADEEWVDAKIQFLIENYFSPPVRRYTLSEMLSRNIDSENIFNGPQLKNGFIDDEELMKSELRKEVRLSDIINIIMDVDGVDYIEDIQMIPCKSEEESCCDGSQTHGDDWILCIPTNHKICYCEESNLQYKKNYLPVGINKERKEAYLDTFRAEANLETLKQYDDFEMPLGNYSDFGNYYSFQNDLPENYGLSQNGLPSHASEVQRKSAKQLKGFLLFIDQIIAIYFSQISNAHKLLSVSDAGLRNNYFANEVTSIKDIEDIVADYPNYQADVQNILGNIDKGFEKRNQMLNHLMSRYGESFYDYYTIFSKLFQDDTSPIDYDALEEKLLSNKNAFLQNYPIMSYSRGLAFDYYSKSPLWDSNEIHAFQRKLSLMIDIVDSSRRDLYLSSYGTDESLYEGMYAIESISFLPTKKHKIIQGLSILGSNPFRWKFSILGVDFTSTITNFPSRQEAWDNFRVTISDFLDSTDYRFDASGHLQLLNSTYDPSDTNSVEVYASSNVPLETQLNKIEDIKAELQTDLIKFKCLAFQYIDHRDEHLQLTPCAAPCIDNMCRSCAPIDFFSYRLYIVFPGWLRKFKNVDFRRFVESRIYELIPAHIAPRVCWVGHKEESDDNDMERLQTDWHHYLDHKSEGINLSSQSHIDLLNKLLCTINHLNNIYEEGHLHDCNIEEEDDLPSGPIILNRSFLGSLKKD